MPEKTFTVAWPNGEQEDCYSPSSTIDQFIVPGKSYDLDDFLQRSEQALTLASERVRKKYGFACSSAQDQLQRIQKKSAVFKYLNNPKVTIISIR